MTTWGWSTAKKNEGSVLSLSDEAYFVSYWRSSLGGLLTAYTFGVIYANS
jgi:hypothetical protein